LHSKKVAIVAEQSLPAQIELRIANNTMKAALCAAHRHNIRRDRQRIVKLD
jgi:hypothetical protein